MVRGQQRPRLVLGSVDPPSRNTEPFSWWGYRSEQPTPRSIIELIERGSLDARTAAFLWLAMEHRASIIVAATPPEAGKTTTLTALLDFLPPEVEHLYLRGWYERFEFLDATEPSSAYLLCNEISPHLPTYLWGTGVVRLFAAVQAGYRIGATIHAGDAKEVLETLAAFPLEVPPELLAGIDLVLTLGVGTGPNGVVRRLKRIEVIHDQGHDRLPEPETIVERDGLLGPLHAPAGRLIGILSRRFGMDAATATEELAQRERWLDRLRQEGVRSIEAVRQAIRQRTT